MASRSLETDWMRFSSNVFFCVSSSTWVSRSSGFFVSSSWDCCSTACDCSEESGAGRSCSASSLWCGSGLC
ncbi:hypothetical protein BC629DRAFT_1506079 [Irpex lacteus]|nr:hypothetical protein BC629DRAFT_1506079 [Irpex lacteus]